VLVLVAYPLLVAALSRAYLGGVKGGLRLVSRKAPPLLLEGEEAQVELVLQYQGTLPLPHAVLRDGFPATRTLEGPPLTLTSSCFDLGGRLRLICRASCDRGYGDFDLGPLEVELSDPLGLFKERFVLGERTRLQVRPDPPVPAGLRLTKANALTPLGDTRSTRTGSSLEFFGLEEYVPGGDVRAICWSKMAQLGRPVLKLFELDTRPEVLLVLNAEGARSVTLDGLLAVALTKATCSTIVLVISHTLDVALDSVAPALFALKARHAGRWRRPAALGAASTRRRASTWSVSGRRCAWSSARCVCWWTSSARRSTARRESPARAPLPFARQSSSWSRPPVRRRPRRLRPDRGDPCHASAILPGFRAGGSRRSGFVDHAGDERPQSSVGDEDEEASGRTSRYPGMRITTPTPTGLAGWRRGRTSSGSACSARPAARWAGAWPASRSPSSGSQGWPGRPQQRLDHDLTAAATRVLARSLFGQLWPEE
jgi:hypothetical protein